jgi:deoxyribodipyrimidine photo-lyase
MVLNTMKSLHWFRADLRLEDNTALRQAMEESSDVLAIFIATPETWRKHDAAAYKVQFILENLRSLSDTLNQQGIPLLFEVVPTFDDCLPFLKELCVQFDIDTLYFNKQYEWDELNRDTAIENALKKQIKVVACDDQLVLPPRSVLKKQGDPYVTFTPFKNTWLQEVEKQQAWMAFAAPSIPFDLLCEPDPIPAQLKGFECEHDLSHWPAGEAAAISRLEHFCENNLKQYHDKRDFPALDGTSQLSPYLAQGVLSPRQCISTALATVELDQLYLLPKESGITTWISELIWREFYKHIMFFHPEVCRHKPFKPQTDKLDWGYDEGLLTAWQQGQTGFPLVDAAMRQLNQTGWMHNRLRMVAAMFLTKTLFLDWRLGEKYFMQHLIDGDLAANNGGWQWSASTGTDAAPYFRIFNPTMQSERFDPAGDFIRQFCPELSELDNKSIHAPYQNTTSKLALDYPEPIVDYPQMRQTVLAAFKALK